MKKSRDEAQYIQKKVLFKTKNKTKDEAFQGRVELITGVNCFFKSNPSE